VPIVNDEILPRTESPDYGAGLSRIEPGRPAGTAPPPPPEPPWWRRRHLATIALAVVLAAVAMGLVVRARHALATKTPADVAPVVSVTVPGRARFTATVTTTGGIVARYDQPIGVEGEGGRVSAILVEVGDHVRQNQVLARLDTSVAEPQVASLRAALEQSRAEAELAAADYRRAAAVADSVGALSKEEVDKRHSQLATSTARVKSAEAQLAEAEARLGRNEIRAPADGIVLTRTAEIGQTATAAGPPLFRLGRGGEIEMRAQVAEQDLPRIRVGQPAEVRLTGIEQPFHGKVRLIAAIIDPQTRLAEIRITLPPNPQLRPGAFARADIAVGGGERPIVAQTAVLADAAGSYVYVIDAGDRVVRRPIRIEGIRAAGIVIAEGLDGSERVAMVAGAFLREGEHVRPVAATVTP
jgi:HlyD family secretion protein